MAKAKSFSITVYKQSYGIIIKCCSRTNGRLRLCFVAPFPGCCYGRWMVYASHLWGEGWGVITTARQGLVLFFSFWLGWGALCQVPHALSGLPLLFPMISLFHSFNVPMSTRNSWARTHVQTHTHTHTVKIQMQSNNQTYLFKSHIIFFKKHNSKLSKR